MAYNFQECFWDQHDNGVNVLLTHISSGIKACDTVVNFFKQKSELEKDFARRLGACNDKLLRDMEHNPDFGNVQESLVTLLNLEKSRAQAHSKQSEIVYRQLYVNTRDVASQFQAKYTTLSGKIEKLRMDKYKKKKGCKELHNRLEEAEVRTRGLKLNQNNTIGVRKSVQNQKELAKWNNNVQEINNQLTVLKQEYKASQKYWLSEWSNITSQFEELESARISFIQAKLQQFADASMETSILEQSRIDKLNNRLAIFTPIDDISEFSSKFGTGRLKEKKQKERVSSSVTYNNIDKQLETPIATDYNNSVKFSSERSVPVSRTTSSTSKRNSYIDSMRMLSSQLQKTRSSSTYIDLTNDENDYSIEVFPEISAISGSMQNIDDVLDSHDHEEIYKFNSSRKIEKFSRDRKAHAKEDSHSSSSSSNPTDFRSHARDSSSADTMQTSVSSFTSSIDDSQRFVKSWNSKNRRRKSVTNSQLPSPNVSDNEEEMELEHEKKEQHHQVPALEHKKSIKNKFLSPEYHVSPSNSNNSPVRENDNLRYTSMNTTIVNPQPSNRSNSKGNVRRKSMVFGESENPIKDALYEMNRIQSSATATTNAFAQSNPQVGRIRDNGITVTLPLITSNGLNVIRYAKAKYPLMENDAPGLAHFEKNDYLLITEIVNNEWYKGEVYGNDMISVSHRNGLIPFNFIEILN